MTSLGRQFDFHGVIYHIWHCNVDNRRRNIVFFQLLDVQNVRKNTRYSLKRVAGNSDSLLKMAELL